MARGTRPSTRPARRSGAPPRKKAKEKTGRRVEFSFLPGLEDVVRDELRSVVGDKPVTRVREDAVAATVAGPLHTLMALRTVVAPFLVLHADVPRPASFLDGSLFPQLVATVREAATADSRAVSHSFRIDAAGRDSAVYRRIAEQLAAATRMRHDPEEGTTLLRFRRSGAGWDVLVRLGNRPLSARAWRRAGYVAAANATVAAAMVRLSKPRPDDRVAALMCGSGTILVERLLAARARCAVGVDLAADAIAAARENLAGAGLTGRATLYTSDIADDDWAAAGPFDVLLSDPPWGDKIGDHAHNEELHTLLLRRAHDVAAPGARLVVLTHEIKIMGRCVAAAADLWQPVSEQRVFNKGHHPRIYVLRRR
ncbi:23S rRNA G2445 N2-methylase RlmL [Pseudonocardia thermophila]|uniref:23S rRNA G2445 N2-methylase RlmL n=1 Tax=Pseudonocardia thermophila TaxID=1848 RepID=A0A1M6WSC0_PSETH|nr:methyltransferase domain-containing protein [Pseudonocardia thermophila]SHK96633.1 23S rRNA G2445 N2-methylase RlmL [Pseudonocardia thermophila]